MNQPTIILIRPFDQSISFATEFLSQTGSDIEIRPSPLLHIVPTVDKIKIGEVSALLFTSTNAVRVYQSLCAPRRIRALCVGAATTKAARAAGLMATSADGDVSDLLELATAQHMEGDHPYLYLRGEDITGDLSEILNDRGTPCQQQVIYRQSPAHMSPDVLEIIKSDSVVIPVFSANSAKALVAELDGVTPKDLKIISISSNASKPLTDLKNITLIQSPTPSRKGMIGCLAATV
jgi:uroporphyrinogen-III synthase